MYQLRAQSIVVANLLPDFFLYLHEFPDFIVNVFPIGKEL